MTNETLSERFAALFAEYEAENMGALGHLNCLKIGQTATIHADVILAALRAAERPTASPDATEAARAMRANPNEQVIGVSDLTDAGIIIVLGLILDRLNVEIVVEKTPDYTSYDLRSRARGEKEGG